MQKIGWIGGAAVVAVILVGAGCTSKDASTTETTSPTTGTSATGGTGTSSTAPAVAGGSASQAQQKASDPNTSEAGKRYLQGR